MTLHIERMSYSTDAIAHDADGKTIFVQGGVAGDEARCEITEEKSSFNRARIIEVVNPSPHRVVPRCQTCGGCPWSQVAYEAQCSFKRQNVVDSLTRVGHMDASRAQELVTACRPAPEPWHYRNKLELNAYTDQAHRLELGMALAGSHDVCAIESCPLADKRISTVPKALRGALRRALGTQEPSIFRIGMRAARNTKDVEIALWTTPGPFPRAAVAKMLKTAVPQATSIVRVIATPGKTRAVKNVERLEGKGCWEEVIPVFDEEVSYLISGPSFFQVNTAQAQVLVEEALGKLAGAAGLDSASGELPNLWGARIADLYSGAGTFSIPLALAGAEVAAVESAKSSVRDLRRNAEANMVDIEVIGGDAAHELPKLGGLDALIVDPPRAGLAKGVPESIAAAKPQSVVYVSCDPATLARDIARFEAIGYRAASVTPVDLFPQTYHVESVVLMSRT